MADYNRQEIIQNLKPYWKKGWPIQIQANGDRAIQSVLHALVPTVSRSPVPLELT